MWIFTNYGFLSAVQHREKKGTLLVRAREPGVLEMLAKRHNVKAVVTETPAADYRFRAEFPQKAFAKMIADEVSRINYCNFKNSFKAAEKENTIVSHSALMDVWLVMRRLQMNIASGVRAIWN